MRETLLTTCLLFYSSLLVAQFGPQQIVSTDAHYPSSVFSADLDGDGDLDILYSSQNGVWWHKNMDGLGLFDTKILIAQYPSELASSVSAADIDGDGDLDVLSTFIDGSPSQNGESRVLWNENLDGLGNFGTQRIITLDAYRPTDSHAADFDADGDLDVLSISRGDDKVAWYENLDGLGNFGAQNVISTQLVFPTKSYIADFDGDGDLDILSQSYDEGKIAWFKNLDGLGTFSNAIFVSLNYPNYSIKDVIGADIDGDNDIDVVATLKVDNKIVWYENIDGSGDFSDANVIAENIPDPNVINATDIDYDGDLDLISSSHESGNSEIYYLINNGLGNFDPPNLITNEILAPTGVYTCDIDLDGRIDLISSSQIDSKIAWYKNNWELGIDDHVQILITVFPNPVNEQLFFTSIEAIIRIEIIDSLGNKLGSFKNIDEVNFSIFASGIYFVKITLDNGTTQVKKVLKE